MTPELFTCPKCKNAFTAFVAFKGHDCTKVKDLAKHLKVVSNP